MQPVFFSPRATVLSCRTNRTTLAVFRQRGERLRLENQAEELHPLPTGKGDHWLENTRNALPALHKKVKPRGPVVLVLPAHLVFTKLVKVPRVAPDKLAKVLGFEAEQHIPYALADMVWDSTVAGGNDAELEILLAAAKLELVEALCEAAHEAGFAPRTVLPSTWGTLAAFRLVHGSPAEPSLVLNLGTHSATLALVEPHRYSVRSFRLGPDRDPKSENAGHDSAAKDISPAKGLAQEISRSILHFRRQSGGANPGVLFLSGTGGLAAGVRGMLSTALMLRVEWLDLTRKVDRRHMGLVEAPPIPADTIGAATLRMRPTRSGLNLLPPRLRQRERTRQRWPWLVAAAVLMMFTPVPGWVHYHRVAVEAGRKAAAIERELAPWAARERRNQASLRRLAELNRRIALLHAIGDRRTSWLGLLADFEGRLHRVGDVWLERLEPAATATGAPMKLVVSGRMLDRANPQSKASPETFARVETLLASLAESPFVARVETGRFNNEQPGILGFDFVILVNPQRPL